MKKTRLPLGKIDRPRSDVAPEKKACDMKPELMKGLIMRRKLMFALLGGLLMQNIVPLDAVGAADKPSDDEITEEMILEFLQNLFKVVKHDDLTDLGFIEQTLGLKAELEKSFEWPTGKKETSYYLKEPKSRLLGQNSIVHHAYRMTQPKQKEPANENGSEKIKVELRLVFSPRTHKRGIAVEEMESVFGKHQFYKEHIAHVSPTKAFLHKEYAYRWQGRNDMWAMFLFDGESGFLMDVKLYQN